MAISLSDEQKILQTLLRQVRKEAGLNQQELAQRLHKPQSFISKYESGERRLDILELREICQQLGIDMVIFISRLEKAILETDASESEV